MSAAGRRVLAATLWVACCAAPLRAEGPQDARRREEQARASLYPTETAILRAQPRLAFDYGVWHNQRFIEYLDDDNDARAEDVTDWTHTVDTRVWLRAMWRPPAGSQAGEQSVYLRMKDESAWRRPQNEHGMFDHDGPHVDQGYLSLDLRPALLQAGRRFYGIGQGIAYSNVHDGAELTLSGARANLMAFVARTLPHEGNLDLTVPGGKKSGRTFYGLEGRYLGVPNHGLYGYVVAQHDDAEERPEDESQDYDYRSRYVGVGSEGKLLADVRYGAELILETGTSLTSDTSQERRVEAWAMDVTVTYDAQVPTQPTLYAEYAFGSGDPDRQSVTDTVGGNQYGADTNFLYFGYLNTGYALSPRLSNLRMLKAGVSLKPLEAVRRWNLRELTARADVYRYYKDEAEGAIFDPQASEPDDDLGTEVDLTLSWPVLSDCTVEVEYGRFMPGQAYAAETNDEARYFSVSLTSTF